jgi:hypothetical protein
MPEHRGDGAGPGSDGRATHGGRGDDPAVVGRRRGEELFRRNNLSNDSVGGLALALPHEGRFPQMGLSRRMFRMGSGEGSNGVSLVGDRWRRRRIDVKRRGDRRGRVLRTGSTRGNRIRHSRKGRGGACSRESPTRGPHAGPSAGEAGNGPHVPATSACASAGDAAAAAGREWGCAPAHGGSGGARARGAPHGGGGCARGGGGTRARGGCSARATRGVGSRSSARGDNSRPGIEGREGGGGERGTRLAGHGAARAWGRGGGGG